MKCNKKNQSKGKVNNMSEYTICIKIQMISKHMKEKVKLTCYISDSMHIIFDRANTVPRIFLKKMSYINIYINAYENVN